MPAESTFGVWANGEDEADFVISFPGIARFRISLASRSVFLGPINPAIGEDYLLHLLYDQVLPRIIAHNGSLVLHGSGVETDRGAIVFLGETGRGKSTLAATFLAKGYRVLGDDAMITSQTENQVLCQSTYPSLRLRSDSFSTILGGNQTKQAMPQGYQKRGVELPPPKETDRAAAPVCAVVFLGLPVDQEAMELLPLSPSQVCMGLIEHSFWLVPNDKCQAKTKLEKAARIAATVPGFQLEYERDFGRVGELADVILDKLQSSEKVEPCIGIPSVDSGTK